MLSEIVRISAHLLTHSLGRNECCTVSFAGEGGLSEGPGLKIAMTAS